MRRESKKSAKTLFLGGPKAACQAGLRISGELLVAMKNREAYRRAAEECREAIIAALPPAKGAEASPESLRRKAKA